MSADNIHAYILAGGRSARFDNKSLQNQNKALKILSNKTLVEHVVDALNAQAMSVTINARPEDHNAFNDIFRDGLGSSQPELIADSTPPYSGPLAGLYACMKHLCDSSDAEWLLLSACDTPFYPEDIAATLLGHIGESRAACIRYQGELQPMFSIWNRNLLPLLKDAVLTQQLTGFKSFIRYLESQKQVVAVIDYPGKQSQTPASPFLNINTEQDLDRAHELLNHV